MTRKASTSIVAVVIVAAACVGTAAWWLHGASNAEAAGDIGAARSTGGALDVVNKEGEVLGTCPLKHTDVRTEISGFVARVEVTQKFHNPYEEKIEAVYTFPLSQNAAVDDMLMKVGEREIRGEIKRREEARRIYQAARRAGHVASLLEQERPNIFTQSVANIMPGENVDVTIRYVEVLEYEDGWFEFSFPTVVGPRYIPGQPTSQQPETPPQLEGKVVEVETPEGEKQPKGTGWSPDTDQVPDASRITPPVTAPGTRAGHDISISVKLDAGAAVRELDPKQHEIASKRDGDIIKVRLKEKATIPNKDFILRYKTASDEIGDAVLTHASELGGFFTLILQPPERVAPEQITPKEMVFVLDSSGSMNGEPIEKAKQTMLHCLANLNPKDTFNFITFAGDTHILFDKPVAATKRNVEKAQDFVKSREGRGGTEMMKAIRAALEPSDSQEHMRIVCFMTDGFVGNDMAIIDEIQRHPNARIFSFGIGASVNRFLLDNMAKAGRGEVDYVTLKTAGEEVAKRFYERLRNPVLTDIEIDWGGLPVTEVYPERILDLFSAKPVVVHGQALKAASGEITLRGKVAGRPFERKIAVELPDRKPEHEVLGPLWARQKMEHLMNQDWRGIQEGKPRTEIKEQIVDLGLKFRLVTQYTSFVAVEWMVITEGGEARRVPVPVEMPEGVSYEGVFGDSMKLGVYSATRLSSRAYAPTAGPAGPVGRPRASSRGGAVDYLQDDVYDLADRVKYLEEKMTPGQKREFRLKQRLATELKGLAEKVAQEGQNGNLTTADGVEVKDGLVEVQIWLSDASDENLAKLKELGLQILGQAKSVNMVIGKLPVEKLEEVAVLDFVVRVEPVPAAGA